MGFLDRLKNSLNPDAALRKQGRVKGPSGEDMVTDGPFAIATDEGRLICKNCGVTFDSATVWTAQGFYMSEKFGPQRSAGTYFGVQCRKCSVYSMFLQSDLPRYMRGMRGRPYQTMTQQGVEIMFDGPLPLVDADGRFICRSCGLSLDEAAYDRARNETHKGNWDTTDVFILRCTNCAQVCGYQMQELNTRPA
jgi:hypothetical protein